MGRKAKKGLDYFSLTTSFSDSIKLCGIELGGDGICILIELWQSIYANNGYYMDLTEDHKMLFIKDSMSGVKIDTFEKCLNVFFKRGVFDKEMYEKYQILTSDSIQERYIDTCFQSKRTNVLIYIEYLLINVEKINNLLIENKYKLGVNTDKLNINSEESTQRKENKIKEDNIKENENSKKTEKTSGIYITFEENISELKNSSRVKDFVCRINLIPESKYNYLIEYFQSIAESEYDGLSDYKNVERHFKNWIKLNGLKILKSQTDSKDQKNTVMPKTQL